MTLTEILSPANDSDSTRNKPITNTNILGALICLPPILYFFLHKLNEIFSYPYAGFLTHKTGKL
jgi:hypothetical protein